MLSRETLQQYRDMTPSERLRLTLEMITENTPYLLRGTPEEIDRRFGSGKGDITGFIKRSRGRRQATISDVPILYTPISFASTAKPAVRRRHLPGAISGNLRRAYSFHRTSICSSFGTPA